MRSRSDLLGGRGEPRRPRTVVLTAVVMCLLLITGMGAVPASATIVGGSIEPGQNITVFHNLDFVAVFGYPENTVITVEVWRGDTKIGVATGETTTEDGVVFGLEVNHGPVGAPQPGDCWTKVTPDIRPGDHIVVTEASGDKDEVIVDFIQFTDATPVLVDDGFPTEKIIVRGTAFYATVPQTPIPVGALDSSGFLETSKLRGGPDSVIATEGVPGGFTMVYEPPYLDNVSDPIGRNVDNLDEEEVKDALQGPGHGTGFGHVDPLPLESMLVDGLEDIPGSPALGCEGSPANLDLTDGDEDLVIDAIDNCPAVINADQLNSDTDGLGNACDPDDDNDTVLDVPDNCDLVANLDQIDSDTDLLGNACDPNDDNDAVLDDADNCPLMANDDQLNSDTDALGNACDTDDDNDTVLDAAEIAAGTNPLSADTDGDGVLDGADACPLVAGTGADGCAPPAPPVDPGGGGGGGGGGVQITDSDGDGVAEPSDNCASVSNADQTNSDSDAQGNACDTDDDNDTVLDGADACPTTPGTTDNVGCAAPATVESSISMALRARLHRFAGAVGASSDACLADRDIIVKRMSAGRDRTVARTSSNDLGKWRVDLADADGRYYAKVRASSIAGPGGSVSQVCGAATSAAIRV